MNYQDVLIHNFAYDDGGRADAGFTGTAGDCATRAIAIATEKPYREVYDALYEIAGKSPRDGVSKKVIDQYLASLGWKWTATMGIGTGCQVHLKAEELPTGRVIARVSKHITAVVNGVVRDTYDPSRDGRRCVYGYWTEG